MKEGQKLSKFLDAIQKDAERRQNNIKRETEAFKKEEMKKIKHEALREAGVIIRKEEEKAKVELNKKLTAHKIVNRNSLILKRQELTDELFEAVKSEIISFVSTDEYIEKVKRDIEAVKDLLVGKITVKSKIGDTSAEKCRALFPKGTEFKVQDSIKLGGIIIILEDGKKVMDFTFDTMLIEEKKRFRAENNLKSQFLIK